MSGRSVDIAPPAGRSVVIGIAVLVGSAAVAFGVFSGPGVGPPDPSRATPPPLPLALAERAANGGKAARGPSKERPALRAGWQSGVNLTANAAGDFLDPGSDAAIQSARRDRNTGLEIVPTWYMTAGTSSAVAPDPGRSPTDEAVVHAVTTARSLGFQVLLKPQVDVLDGTYRGRVVPADRAAWFASYRAMVVHYAQLATAHRVGGFVVGVELGTMVERPADTAWWRELIRSVRGLGYRGRLTYAANWDQLGTVGFWRSLDYIGIDAYFPLVPRSRAYSPTTDELVAAWRDSYTPDGHHDWVAEVERLQRAQRRPVVFTELGYGATACTTVAPYELDPACAAGGMPTKPSERAQRNAYVAALRVWSRIPVIAGIYWWDWPTDANAKGDFYSPRGKLAEQSMVLWNAARGTLPR